MSVATEKKVDGLAILRAILQQDGMREFRIIPDDDDDGDRWATHQRYELRHAAGDGRGLFVWFDRYQQAGRMMVNPIWPRAQHLGDYHGKVQSITLDYKREPARLASEIVRRLLAPYYVEFIEQSAKKRKAESDERFRLSRAAELAAIIGVEAVDHQTGKPREIFYPYHKSGVYKVVVNYHGNNVEIEINGMEFELAKKVLELIAAHQPAPESESDD